MERFAAAAAISQMTENNIQHAGMISAGNEGFGMKFDNLRDEQIRAIKMSTLGTGPARLSPRHWLSH
jgi:hypothetical protein